MNKDPHRYDDIIEKERPVSKRHAPMNISDRAAQFAPFAALTGHGAAVSGAAEKMEADIEERNSNEIFHEDP